jgi:hypothetical protein
MSVMKAQDTPSGTRMMWKASVNAICDRAHGTGSTVSAPRASTAADTDLILPGVWVARRTDAPHTRDCPVTRREAIAPSG